MDHDLAVGLRLFGRPRVGDHRGETPEELGDAAPGDRRDGGIEVQVRGRLGEVGLGADDEARAGQQLGAVALELAQEDLELSLRRGAVGRCQVEKDDQDPGPLDVAQEAVAETFAFGGAFDETGDVGQDELDLVEVAAHAHRRRGSVGAW